MLHVHANAIDLRFGRVHLGDCLTRVHNLLGEYFARLTIILLRRLLHLPDCFLQVQC